jgi:DNA-binding CsgD family transcriptional regulator
VRSWPGAEDAVLRVCAAGGPERALRAAVLREIRAVVPFDHYVWALTDPVTAVGTAPLAQIPALSEVPRVIRAKYLAQVNRWTTLQGAATLATAGGAGALWREVLAGQGVVDVLSAVHRDRYGTWGFLDLWRCTGTFTPAETGFVARLGAPLAQALRSAVAGSVVPGGPAASGPVVLTLTDELVAQQQTPATDAQLRALLPTPPDQPPVPAVALNVAAQLLAGEAGVDGHPPTARLTRGAGGWVTVRAARLGAATIAVTVEQSTTAERVEVYTRALGLTARETQLVEHLVTGADTRGTARALGIAEHTVNDHLKSIFAKAGTNSRRQLVANATG